MKTQTQNEILAAIRKWGKDSPEPQDLMQVLETLSANIGACHSLRIPVKASATMAEVVIDSISDVSCFLEDFMEDLENQLEEDSSIKFGICGK
jgi:hypothetical protein